MAWYKGMATSGLMGDSADAVDAFPPLDPVSAVFPASRIPDKLGLSFKVAKFPPFVPKLPSYDRPSR